LNVFDDLCIWLFCWQFMRRVECSWRIVYMIVLLIICEKRWTILTICVYDSSIDNFREEFKYINRQNSQQPENCENGNEPDLVQAFLKKLWIESDFKAPNLPLSLRLKVSGFHYNSIYNNTCTKQVKQLS
jgi:hypothetical protein